MRRASPPLFGLTQMSPAYAKAIWVALIAGWRRRRAGWACAICVSDRSATRRATLLAGMMSVVLVEAVDGMIYFSKVRIKKVGFTDLLQVWLGSTRGICDWT